MDTRRARRGRRREVAEAPAGIAIETSMGWVGAVSRRGRLIRTSLPAPGREACLRACGEDVDFGGREGLLGDVADDLRRYFDGEAVDLARHPVDLSGLPAFSRRALNAAARIPHGQIRTYGWVAVQAGRPDAARAAGGAMGRNPIPLVIPCHRVVAAGGALGGFGGGLEMKRALLDLEGVRSDARGVLAT
jgi:methylated-DNA-[protein]-cysteine S-methyltransferase